MAILNYFGGGLGLKGGLAIALFLMLAVRYTLNPCFASWAIPKRAIESSMVMTMLILT